MPLPERPRGGDYDFGWGEKTRKRGERSTASIVAVGVGLVAFIALGIGAYMLGQRTHVPTDPETLCPADRPVAALVVIVLDVSDDFTDIQKLAIENEITRLRDGLDRFAFVQLYTLEGAATEVVSPVIHLCNPGTGEDLNEIYQNPERAKKKWEEAFAGKLRAKLDELLDAPGSPTSPIFEAIQATSVRSFGRPEHDKVAKRLVLFSDLLQNVPAHSHYRGVPSFEDFRESDYYESIRANLDGVQVTLHYLNRPDVAVQGVDHIEFWERYFGAQGASVRNVERIYGDGR